MTFSTLRSSPTKTTFFKKKFNKKQMRSLRSVAASRLRDFRDCAQHATRCQAKPNSTMCDKLNATRCAKLRFMCLVIRCLAHLWLLERKALRHKVCQATLYMSCDTLLGTLWLWSEAFLKRSERSDLHVFLLNFFFEKKLFKSNQRGI